MTELTVGTHPAQFTESIIDELEVLIPKFVPAGRIIHDPFAGAGVRLGALCDRLGYEFTGTDLEAWREGDSRVAVGNSRYAASYPTRPHAEVTSPTYNNGVNDHFKPSIATHRRRRLTYRVAAGRPLHSDNTGRHSGRSSKKGEARYWSITRDVVAQWSDIAIVNVKDSIRAGAIYPLVEMWTSLLAAHGYTIERFDVPCPGFRWGANRELRADTEAILVAVRP